MNKTKKQIAFNIFATFGVLSLLALCIYSCIYIYTPKVLAYVESSYECTLISQNEYYMGSGFYDSNMIYDYTFDNNKHGVTLKYIYSFGRSLEFDSFIFTFCNYNGILDEVFDYTVSAFSLNVAIEGEYDSGASLGYELSQMFNFVRRNNEMQSYFSWSEAEDYYGCGSYLINFHSSQEIYHEGYLALYVYIQFEDMPTSTWNSFKSYFIMDSKYEKTGVIQVLNVGVVESEGSYNNGWLQGYEQGKGLSNQAQYDAGYTAGVQAGGNIGSWLAGIGEAPLTLIKSLFNIEIFGINLNTIVFSLLGALVVIKLIRLFI